MRTALPLLVAACLAPLATAQSATPAEDGCVRSNPCPWSVDVDADGFFIVSQVNFTQGDWHELFVFNEDDERSHTVTLSGHDLRVTVGAGDFATDTGAFAFEDIGSYVLRDEPTGDEVIIQVLEEDVVEAESDSTSEGADGADPEDAPGVPLALLAVALLAGVAARRGR